MHTKMSINGVVLQKRVPGHQYAYPITKYAINVTDKIIDNKIEITLPPGEYYFNGLSLYETDSKYIRTDLENMKIRGVREVQTNKNKVKTIVNAEEDAQLFFSIPYSKGWQAKINGEKIDVVQTNKAFISIPIKKGENDITLTYVTPGFKLGVFLSLLGLVFFLVYSLKVRKKNKI